MSFAKRTQVLCLGDSITEWADSKTGWLTDLRRKYGRRADFQNRGYAGFTTGMVLEKIIPLLVLDGKIYDVAIVFLGANDARNFCDLSKFSKNLEKISTSLSVLCKKLFFVSPLSTYYSSELVTYNNSHVETYVNAMRSDSYSFIDMYSVFTEPHNLLCDGLHPNEKGNILISEVIERNIDSFIQPIVDVEWYVEQACGE